MFKYILLFMVIVLLSQTQKAQITITAADVAAQYATGSTHLSNFDTTATKINIGAPGSNTWDFSNLQSVLTFSMKSVDPAATPYKNDFPNANIALFYTLQDSGIISNVYLYYRLENDYTALGLETSGEPAPGITYISKTTILPPAIQLKLPATLGTSWQQTYSSASEQIISGNPFRSDTSTIVNSAVIDAYGTAKFPDGKTVDVLRLKIDQKTYVPSFGQTFYSRAISYSFISRSGDILSVSALDTTGTENGEIFVEGVTWNSTAVTAVDDKVTPVNTFSLEQNYPNPFNPSTTIRYSIAEESFVEMKIYDLVGKEVRTLVSRPQNKGNYIVSFNAGDLPSGIYIARLKAGSYTKSIKVLLMK